VGGKLTFADPAINGEVAPIPAIRATIIESVESTLNGS
jgi:hypothetical protein